MGSKDNEIAIVLEYCSLMLHNHIADKSKTMNEIWKSIQDLDRKVSKVQEMHFFYCFEISYKGRHITVTSQPSSATLKARKACNHIFQILTIINCQLRLLYTAKLSFKVGSKMESY